MSGRVDLPTLSGSLGKAWDEIDKLKRLVSAAKPAAADYYPPMFQPLPLAAYDQGLAQNATPSQGINWILKDDLSRSNHIFSNRFTDIGTARTPAVNDYATFPVMLGPAGSTWGLFGTWKLAPDGGRFHIELGSVASPAAPLSVGEGLDGPGTLADPTTVTYHTISPFDDDTYSPVTSYAGGSSIWSAFFVLSGDVGDPFTTILGYNGPGAAIIDGGPGFYRWKIKVTGQNGASIGYGVDFQAWTWARLDTGPYT